MSKLLQLALSCLQQWLSVFFASCRTATVLKSRKRPQKRGGYVLARGSVDGAGYDSTALDM